MSSFASVKKFEIWLTNKKKQNKDRREVRATTARKVGGRLGGRARFRQDAMRRKARDDLTKPSTAVDGLSTPATADSVPTQPCP